VAEIIFAPKRDEVAEGWRLVHYEKLRKSSPDIARVIKSRRMKWAVNVACMGEIRNAYKVSVG
jgi:hypothetical protein